MIGISVITPAQYHNAAARLERQIPFALSRAINDTARDVVLAQRAVMQEHLDRPTPFTLRGAAVLGYASKARLEAVVGFRPIQAAYLRFQIEGGTRTPKARAILVPAEHARLNRYGNLPKGYVARVLNGKKGFVASRNDPKTRHLPAGIYQRGNKRGDVAKLLVAFEDKADYDPIYPFYETAAKTARAAIVDHFTRNLAQAVASAR